MKPPGFLVRRLVGLGVLLIAMPFLAGWSDRLMRASLDRLIDPRPAFTVLFWVCVAGVVLTLVRLAAVLSLSRGGGWPALHELATEGVLGTLWRVFRGRILPDVRRTMQLTLWAVIVFTITAILSALGTLDEVRYLPEQVLIHRWSDSSSTVRVFFLDTPDNNPVEYLRDLTAITRALRSAGARLVVVQDPGPIHTVNTRLGSWYTNTRDSLRRSADVVLFERPPEWVRSMFAYRPLGWDDTVYLSGSTLQASIDPAFWTQSSRPRWAPCLRKQGEAVYVDVGLRIAGKVLGVPDSTAILCLPGRVLYGSIDVSVNAEGWAPVMASLDLARVFLNTSAGRGIGSDTLWYFFNNTKQYTFDRSVGFPDQEIPAIAGSIILVEWFARDEMHLSGLTYAGLVGSLVRGDSPKLYGHLSLWITAGVVILGAFLGARLRPRTVLFVMLGLGVVLYGGGLWALIGHRLVLALSYPAVAALLSAVIFPLVRLSHEQPEREGQG